MADDPRVQQLLDELLDSDATPEAVCGSCVELLPVVRDRWRQVCHARAELDALFPPAVGPGASRPAPLPDATALPSIPGYEVQAVLGVGGMGVVFRARHLQLNRVVAVKMALAGAAGAPERARFQREAEAVAALRHPNVVQIYEVGEAGGRPYFSMEYVEGGTLGQQLTGAPRLPREAAALVATLAGAVHAAHEGGIVHRDLKPANVFLTADGTPKVGDFGLARRLDGEAGVTRVGTAVGTPSSMAPEQAGESADAAGPAADVYALGSILYELLTGRPPFRAERADVTLYQLLTQDPVPPARRNPKVPRDLETVCLKCLQKGPRLRYATAAALADDLERFLRGEAIAARPQGRLGTLARRVCRRPVLAAALAVATLSTVALLGGGAWTLSERAAAEQATAAERAARERAADGDLREMADAMKASLWAEAKAAHERAKGRLGPGDSAPLRSRLAQGTRDLALVADLEEIRLLLSGAGAGQPAAHSPEKLYAAAFRRYGIDLLVLEPAEAARRIRDSAVRVTMVGFLHDWLYWISDADRAVVQSVADLADGDGWRRAYREAIADKDRDTGVQKLKALVRVPGAAAQPPVILSGFCGSLLAHGQRADALAVLSEAQQGHPEDFWLNYLLGHFWAKDHPRRATGYFRAAVAVRPTSDQAYSKLAGALRDAGDTDAAVAAFSRAAALNPSCPTVKELAKLLAPKGRLGEALGAWDRLLARNPPDDDSWYGHAQLCLFLGHEDAYRRARTALLDRDRGDAGDWRVAERTGLACLLLPAADEELRRAVELVDRAAALAPKSPHLDNAYVQFAQGLAEYRQGRPERAIGFLEDSAGRLVNRPGPRLVLAMARHRTGSTGEARKTLAEAVLAYDWRATAADHTTAWVSHALRREAEGLILPDLPAFLAGTHQPRTNDERLALLGVCQFANRTHAAARLYRDAFAADPRLAEDDPSGIRSNAAGYAAQVGCGRGADAAGVGEAERARWRSQAREWLRADLAAGVRGADAAPAAARGALRRKLLSWRAEPDLAGLRESADLEKLPPDERKDCQALWGEVSAAILTAAGDK